MIRYAKFEVSEKNMQEEFELFRAETKDIKPIKQDTVIAPHSRNARKKSDLRELREKTDTLFYFSDEKERVDCASIMTGYGTFTLKKQIPFWLVQHPKVRALHQAPKEWGGEAAMLILLDV